jgi:hypothetical protein
VQLPLRHSLLLLHGCPFFIVHTPPPLQALVVVQFPGSSSPLGRNEHSPMLSGRAHDTQVALHGTSQHTPSTQ